MDTLTLTTELRKIVESQMDQVIKGIEHTFSRIIETYKITPTDLKEETDSLERKFSYYLNGASNPLHSS